MKRIIFIPMRKGSKGIPGKHLRYFGEKPLVSWVLDTLHQSTLECEIWIATDCCDIITYIENKYPMVNIFRRSKRNASDYSSTNDVILEFIENQDKPDDCMMMIAQATVPFTTKEDFENGFSLLESNKYDSIVACKKEKVFYWDEKGKPLNYQLQNKLRRQDFEGVLIESGAFYASKINTIKSSKNILSGNIGVYKQIPHIHIDLDEELDWVVGEAMIKFNGND